MKHAPGDLVVVQAPKRRCVWCELAGAPDPVYIGKIGIILAIDLWNGDGRFYLTNFKEHRMKGPRNAWGCDECLRKYQPPAEDVGVRREEEALA